MYDVYTVWPVAEKLPLDITCVAVAGESVLAGTRTGALLVYKAKPSATTSARREWAVQVCKTFVKRPVAALAAQQSQALLLCLSDGTLSAHDLDQLNFPVAATLLRAKGLSLLASAVVRDRLLVAVAQRRRVLLFEWKGREFRDLPPIELSFPETVRALAWCGEMLGVAVRDEYCLVRVLPDPLTGSRQEELGGTLQLFSSGTKAPEPLILHLPRLKVTGFARDDNLVFVNASGDLAGKEVPELPWSEPPSALALDSPFVLGLLGKRVEVRSVKPNLVIQALELPKAKFMASSGGLEVFLAGSHDIWCLSGTGKLRTNIAELARDRQYELALELAERGAESGRLEGSAEEKAALLRDIRKAFAFHLYYQRRFEEAFRLYMELGEEVLYVIGLFPDLLPDDVASKLKYPEALLQGLDAEERRDGLRALAHYLSEVRTTLAQGLASGKWSGPELLNNQGLLQIVDTVLLKCYLETSELLVSSLLRLRDNACNVAVSEKLLLKRGKFQELFLLYERKGMHQEALDLLRSQGQADRTIGYLQNLGPTQLPLIFKYAPWVLGKEPAEGLAVFTEDCEEVRALDREQVLRFLQKEARHCVVPYLEHLVWEWHEEAPKFHNALGEAYLGAVKSQLEAFIRSLPEGHEIPGPGREPGELGSLRKRLLHFLSHSHAYSPEILLVQLPQESLLEERAMVLGRLGRHEQAIAIYTQVLLDYKAAEAYANRHYGPSEADRGVYLTLLRAYAAPEQLSAGPSLASARPQRPLPNVALALQTLKTYAGSVDTVAGCGLMPGEVGLGELWVAVEAVLQETANRRRREELRRALFGASLLRRESARVVAESRKVSLGYDAQCRLCKKRISNSAFLANPDGSLLHYFCHKQQVKPK